MQHRIGLNSGRMVTGNMGSEMRMNYTMMGDTVNLAARFESGSKAYGQSVGIMVNDAIYDQVSDLVLISNCKPDPFRVYEKIVEYTFL